MSLCQNCTEKGSSSRPRSRSRPRPRVKVKAEEHTATKCDEKGARVTTRHGTLCAHSIDCSRKKYNDRNTRTAPAGWARISPVCRGVIVDEHKPRQNSTTKVKVQHAVKQEKVTAKAKKARAKAKQAPDIQILPMPALQKQTRKTASKKRRKYRRKTVPPDHVKKEVGVFALGRDKETYYQVILTTSTLQTDGTYSTPFLKWQAV